MFLILHNRPQTKGLYIENKAAGERPRLNSRPNIKVAGRGSDLYFILITPLQVHTS